MKDIPVFSCPDGIATLILREVPFRGEGYILVRGVFGTLEGLLAECAGFCRAAGAERLFAAGEANFSGYPGAGGPVRRAGSAPDVRRGEYARHAAV